MNHTSEIRAARPFRKFSTFAHKTVKNTFFTIALRVKPRSIAGQVAPYFRRALFCSSHRVETALRSTLNQQPPALLALCEAAKTEPKRKKSFHTTQRETSELFLKVIDGFDECGKVTRVSNF
jgi:hypothetical protein